MKKVKVSSEWIKLIIMSLLILICIITMKAFGIYDYISIHNIENLKGWIKSFNSLGPIVYILIFIGACLFFFPAPPFVILAGVIFGPLMGTLWTAVGALIADGTAFLVARYGARGIISKIGNKNEKFRKIDEGVKEQGLRILIITRLIPVFPYMIQSYAYGLTNMKFSSYILVSWICTIPGIMAFTFMGGAIGSGGSLSKIFMYLAVGAILFVGISLIPRYVVKKKGIDIMN
ncbi:MAG: TVP38/TMEM64 family protein [Anaeromicrobium sp.]|jgi:uncharacterized membrane protein YdjX (TVP38/TMEM64 family)|uniref:TVP38/TMEM64 family protein n=1 Tax=Anaeromicrobium sp. TaxID=1929132 RepID=UPI0025FE5BD7|nr:TVP38/TMEM64 family protein [Anaeromicrobium sp.]MCT4595095.1 TVP38/TMEM64 family protein [Anaeromicrobium sp.]